jgi:hypothetical protein
MIPFGFLKTLFISSGHQGERISYALKQPRSGRVWPSAMLARGNTDRSEYA